MKVRKSKVPHDRITVIRNAIGSEAFVAPDVKIRHAMQEWFKPVPRWLIGAAGRLSPEKGFSILVEAASCVCKTRDDVGFVLFGEGPLRPQLETQIAQRQLQGRFVLAGFREDWQRYLPNLDLLVISSYTEGLPVVLLEAGAAGIAAVATTVGGIPEVIDDGHTGSLVPAGDPRVMAERILTLLEDDAKRRAMGVAARARVQHDFSFTAMAQQYHTLFGRLLEQRAHTSSVETSVQ